MPADALLLVWSGGELLPVGEAPVGALLAADSWLVDEGRVRGYDAHWERFGGWCADLRTAELDAFRAAVTAALPRAGRWFPRVDLVGSAGGRAGAALVLRLRPAPALMGSARVLLGSSGDPRGHPGRKGPDLPLLMALREHAVAAGAGELMLRDADGRLLEGALNSLLWWEEDALCTTPDERTLPSITRALLLGIARERGAEVRRRSPFPEQLAGREAWLANAAHGICVVTAWDPDGPPAGAPDRAESWRAALDATARHLDG
jgi:branched-subunit amino acid aminotransferase/4-amino-4-deoxychorismate lyase